jgi:hypothetical protein
MKLTGELLALLEHRATIRRLDCPLVFRRGGQPIGDFRKPLGDGMQGRWLRRHIARAIGREARRHDFGRPSPSALR